VAQAFFLFFNPKRREWDERGEVYVRYGPPERADYNPLGTPMSLVYSTGMSYPLNTLVWSYPSLGMEVQMQDRVLSEYYLLPVSMVQDMDPRPDPTVLAARGDVIASRGGRGVFPLLPPRTQTRPVAAVLARFAGEHGPRLMGQVETPGGPDDAITAEWVVLDTAMVEGARVSRAAGVSACDPTTLRAADFASAGKVKVHKLNHRPVPSGWVVDGDGRPVTDAATAFAHVFEQPDGGITPLGGPRELGGHKGYGLAVMVEILGGTLAGSTFSPLRNQTQKPSDPHNIGHFFMAIDPRAFRAGGEFEEDLDQVIDVLHNAKRVDPNQPVLVAGDPEMATRAERLRDGVPVPDDLMDQLRAVAKRAEVPFVLAGR
jgi:hypothetical protein